MDEFSTKKSKKVSLLAAEQSSVAENEISSDRARSDSDLSNPSSSFPSSNPGGHIPLTEGSSSHSQTQSTPPTLSKWKLQPPGVYYSRMKNIIKGMLA
jgi:hypothetical protein